MLLATYVSFCVWNNCFSHFLNKQCVCVLRGDATKQAKTSKQKRIRTCSSDWEWAGALTADAGLLWLWLPVETHAMEQTPKRMMQLTEWSRPYAPFSVRERERERCLLSVPKAAIFRYSWVLSALRLFLRFLVNFPASILRDSKVLKRCLRSFLWMVGPSIHSPPARIRSITRPVDQSINQSICRHRETSIYTPWNEGSQPFNCSFPPCIHEGLFKHVYVVMEHSLPDG